MADEPQDTTMQKASFQVANLAVLFRSPGARETLKQHAE